MNIIDIYFIDRRLEVSGKKKKKNKKNYIYIL